MQQANLAFLSPASKRKAVFFCHKWVMNRYLKAASLSPLYWRLPGPETSGLRDKQVAEAVRFPTKRRKAVSTSERLRWPQNTQKNLYGFRLAFSMHLCAVNMWDW
ncbi:hypothetical protein MPNT_120065 [Candidatus Methylacidithermus pantelleriae]|uniref:Uncharacterized protein n=1 Tax=Candidatus Methylacidithermus pantelleriae TaxID=2744239 RepID=A0A8J2BLC1_9BACT|nr:hypothetical protein MPNT_120065 [Candidatus Methylacidithermus pantelleriae]